MRSDRPRLAFWAGLFLPNDDAQRHRNTMWNRATASVGLCRPDANPTLGGRGGSGVWANVQDSNRPKGVARVYLQGGVAVTCIQMNPHSVVIYSSATLL